MGRKASELKVAILVATGFEQVELTEPIEALTQAGLHSDIVSPEVKVIGWDRTDWGEEFDVDVSLDNANPRDYDVLFLPGGVMNPDGLRHNTKAAEFVSSFFEAGKPVAALCHGPWHLIDSGVARSRKRNSYHSVRTDFQNFVDRMLEEFGGEAENGNSVPLITDDSDVAPGLEESTPTSPPQVRQQMILWLDKRKRSATSRPRAR